MKTILLFTAGILLISFTHANAQANARLDRGDVLLGPVVGFGHSWVSNLPGDYMFKPAGYAGIGLIDMVTNHFGLGGQAIISLEGYQVDYFNSSQTVTPLYLRFPMRAYYIFGHRGNTVRPDLYLGPSFAMKLGEHSTVSTIYRETYMVGNTDNFRMFDAGIDGGAGINIQLAKNIWLSMDLGFYEGVTDAVKDFPNTYDPNHDVDLNLGVLFGIR